MELDKIKDMLIYTFSIITCLGVPLLIYLIWTQNKSELITLNSFIDKALLNQLNEYKTEKKEINKKLKNYLESLEYEIFDKPEEDSNERIKILQSIKNLCEQNEELTNKAVSKLYDNYNLNRGDIFPLIYISKYSLLLTKIIINTGLLIGIEIELLGRNDG